MHVTDFSKCMMPPPMSMLQYNFGQHVTGASKLLNHLLIITTEKVYIWDLVGNKIITELKLGVLQ